MVLRQCFCDDLINQLYDKYWEGSVGFLHSDEEKQGLTNFDHFFFNAFKNEFFFGFLILLSLNASF